MTKIEALKCYRNNSDKAVSTSEKGKLEIQWWINNIENSCHHR